METQSAEAERHTSTSVEMMLLRTYYHFTQSHFSTSFQQCFRGGVLCALGAWPGNELKGGAVSKWLPQEIQFSLSNYIIAQHKVQKIDFA